MQKYFCSVAIPSEDTAILEFNHYIKSDKTQSDLQILNL